MTQATASPASGKARMLLLKDVPLPIDPERELLDLRCQLSSLPEFQDVELSQNGRSTVLLCVPAANKRKLDRLRAVANRKLRGWKVVDEQSYSLPRTF